MGFGYFPYVQGDAEPIIYDTSGTQLFKLWLDTTNVRCCGTSAAGKDFDILANAADSYPEIRLLGNGGVYHNYAAGSYVIYGAGAVVSHRLTYAANLSNFFGGNVSGDSSRWYANATDAYPFIHQTGNGEITIFSKGNIQFNNEAVYLGKITSEKTLMLLETTTPTAQANSGQFYTKNDNKAYFQDGAGAEHEIAFVP